MPAKTKRNRSAGAIATLNLQDASAANRRFEVDVAGGLGPNSQPFMVFWAKTSGVAVDIDVYLVDKADSDRLYPIDAVDADTQAGGFWYPYAQMALGQDVDAPGASGFAIRVQFSQAGAACTANLVAFYGEA